MSGIDVEGPTRRAPLSDAGGSSRRRRQPGDRANLLRVQRLGLEQRAGKRIELFAVETKQAVRLSMALFHDAPDFGVNQLGGRLAVGLPLKSWRQAIFLRREKLIGPIFSLMPQRSTMCRAISVTCCRSFSAPVVRHAVDELLRRAAAQGAVMRARR